MVTELPSITGKQLIRLLLKDGWQDSGKRTHGVALVQGDPEGRSRVTVIPDKRSTLAAGTLSAMLSSQPTGIGRQGLRDLIGRYGLR